MTTAFEDAAVEDSARCGKPDNDRDRPGRRGASASDHGPRRRRVGPTARRAPANEAARESRGRDARLSLLSVKELADILRTSPKAVYTMFARGQLPAPVCIGRRRLLREQDLIEWLAERRAVSPKEIR